MPAHIITPESVTIFLDDNHYVIPNDHPNYINIIRSIQAKKWDEIHELANISQTVHNWLGDDSDFQLEGDTIVFNGQPFTQEITDKVLNMIQAGNNPEPLYNFLRKLRDNPSATSQKELLLFCVANNFMIHEDGDIIAYKSVNSNYKDIHSGRVNNTVGTINEMSRGQVDDDRNRTCSTGYHFASIQYATTWHHLSNAHLMVMKINPMDVVSIPSDYNNQKGRCCRYEVIAEIPHGDNLVRKEVYTNQDMYGETARKAENQTRKQEIVNELDDLYDEKDCIENDINDLWNKVNQIEHLGGNAAELLSTIDRFNDEISNISDSIHQLENEEDELSVGDTDLENDDFWGDDFYH